MSVGKFLMEARVGAGLTQKSVSLFLGYSSAQFISNYERGISIPPLKKLKILHKLTGFDVNEFVSLAMEAEKRVMQETLGSGPRGGSRLAPALPVNWR